MFSLALVKLDNATVPLQYLIDSSSILLDECKLTFDGMIYMCMHLIMQVILCGETIF